jgi:hypothetical protein
MEEPRPDPITKSYIAGLIKKKNHLEIETMNSIILLHEQQKAQEKKGGKKSKKRPVAPEPVAAAAEPAAVAQKKLKLKPEGWLCEGNLVTGTECTVEPEKQVVAGTLHEGKRRKTCKVCKKDMKKTLKEQQEK